MDYFTSLSSLSLFSVVPVELLDKASEHRSIDQIVTYYFDSEQYSRPHRVSVNEKRELQEMALTIPKAQAAAYQEKVRNLGKPDAVQSIGINETILVFPSRGIGLSVDSEQLPLEIMVFKPTTAQNFVTEKLYPSGIPVTVVTQAATNVPTPLSTQSVETPSSPIGNNSNIFWYYGLIIVQVILILALLWIYFHRLKARRPTDNQLP